MIEQVQEVHTDESMYRVGANALSARGFVAVPVMGKHGLLSKRADRAAKLEVAEDSTDDLGVALLFLTYRLGRIFQEPEVLGGLLQRLAP